MHTRANTHTHTHTHTDTHTHRHTHTHTTVLTVQHDRHPSIMRPHLLQLWLGAPSLPTELSSAPLPPSSSLRPALLCGGLLLLLAAVFSPPPLLSPSGEQSPRGPVVLVCCAPFGLATPGSP